MKMLSGDWVLVSLIRIWTNERYLEQQAFECLEKPKHQQNRIGPAKCTSHSIGSIQKKGQGRQPQEEVEEPGSHDLAVEHLLLR